MYNLQKTKNMRKLFYASIALLCMTIVAACSGSGSAGGSSESDPMVGKWQLKKDIEENNGQSMKATWVMDLNADKTMASNIDVLVEGSQNGFSMKLPLSMGFEGTWSTADDMLTISADSATTKLNIDKDKVEIKFDNPKLEAMADVLKEAAFGSISKNMQGNMLNNFIGKDAVRYQVDGSKLLLFTTKDTLVFEKQ